MEQEAYSEIRRFKSKSLPFGILPLDILCAFSLWLHQPGGRGRIGLGFKDPQAARQYTFHICPVSEDG